jgi:nucleotide-binding universal stress UspA family protein
MNGLSGGDPQDRPSTGVAEHAPLRFLVALCQRSELADLASYIAIAGAGGRGIARVVHVVGFGGSARSPVPESAAHASALIEEAVFTLQLAGIGASGTVRHASLQGIGPVLIDEARNWRADAIVMRAPRPRRWHRFFGHGVLQQVLHRSTIATVLVSPRQRAAEHYLRHRAVPSAENAAASDATPRRGWRLWS